jgi:peroxin-19
MQHQMLREILVLFDNAKTPAEDAAAQERVLDIMQRMQEYGQPPRELMSEIAPNMFFNEQGAGAAASLPKELEGCPVQ